MRAPLVVLRHLAENQPWMCYDGPERSFQAYIPAETARLQEARKVIERDGIWGMNAMFGQRACKGYCMARWEGSCVRVFYDRLVAPQPW